MNAIKNQILVLKIALQSVVLNGLNDQLLIAHTQLMLVKLEAIIPLAADNLFATITDLTTLLSDNWALTKGTSVCVTAEPTSLLTELLCNIAEWIGEQIHRPPILLLMPTLVLESLRDGYPDLSTVPLKRVLKTHVLGDDHNHLIPVQLLTELDLSPHPEPLWIPYVSLNRTDEAYAYRITPNECRRLTEHSSLTQALIAARENYLLLMNDTSNVLGQLQRLCAHLAMNSAYATGTQTHAGANVYPAIIHFMDYYHKLGHEQQAHLPTELKKNIDILLAQVSDPRENMNATVQIETCVASRRVKLMMAMKNQEGLLSQISLQGLKKDRFVEDAKAEFEKAKKGLKTALDLLCYDGKDKLKITLSLLSTLKISIRMTSLRDLNFIQTLDVSEINELLTSPPLIRRIVNTLSSIESLVIFIIETPPEKIPPFLNALSDELLAKITRSPMHLAALLISLDSEKFKLVCDSLGKKIITTAKQLSILLKHVSPDQQEEVLNTIPLKKLLKSGRDIFILMSYASPQQKKVILEQLKKKRPMSVHEYHFIRLTTEPGITPDERTVILKRIKPYLSQFMNYFEMRVLLRLSTIEQLTLILDAVKARLPELSELDDVAYIMETLDPEASTVYFNTIKEYIPISIFSVQSLVQFYDVFSKSQRIELYRQWPEHYKKIYQLSAFHQMYSPTYPANPCERVFTPSPNVALQKKRLGILRANQAYLSLTIGSAKRFKNFFQSKRYINDKLSVVLLLFPAEREQIFHALKKLLPHWINSADDFKTIAEPLTPKQRTVVFEAIKPRLSELIKTQHDVACFKDYLTQKENEEIYTPNWYFLLNLMAKPSHQVVGFVIIIAAIMNQRGNSLLETALITTGLFSVAAFFPSHGFFKDRKHKNYSDEPRAVAVGEHRY